VQGSGHEPWLPPSPGDPALPSETVLPPETVLAEPAAELVGVALGALDDGVAGVLAEELRVAVAAVEVLARWVCAAWLTNRPRLAAPAVTTTATANRARLRTSFMAQP